MSGIQGIAGPPIAAVGFVADEIGSVFDSDDEDKAKLAQIK